MQACNIFRVESPPTTESVRGFCLTQKYMVAVGKKIIVHGLECQTCEYNKGQICRRHEAKLDTGVIWDAKSHPTSNLLLTAEKHTDDMVLWDLDEGERVRNFSTRSSDAVCVLFLDASRYVSGGSHGAIVLWEREQPEPTRVLRGHAGRIEQLAATGTRLFSSGEDRTVRMWDIATGTFLQGLKNFPHSVSALTFGPDYTKLRAGYGRVGKTDIWEWENEYSGLTLELGTKATHPQVYLNVDDNMVTGGNDGVVRTWTQDGDLLSSFQAHPGSIRGLFKVGRFLITVGATDGTIKIWVRTTEKWVADLQDPVSGRIDLAIMGSGKLAISWIPSGDHRRVQVWDLKQIQDFASKIDVRKEPVIGLGYRQYGGF